MFKKILCVFILYLTIPVFAGELDNALNNNDKVFAYVYKPYCSYCVKFDTIYNKLSKKYGDKCKFIKMDLNSSDGYKLVRKYNVRYVPFVIAIDNTTGRASQIQADCLIDNVCVDAVVNDFVK